jgi:hypothetical protein
MFQLGNPLSDITLISIPTKTWHSMVLSLDFCLVSVGAILVLFDRLVDLVLDSSLVNILPGSLIGPVVCKHPTRGTGYPCGACDQRTYQTLGATCTTVLTPSHQHLVQCLLVCCKGYNNTWWGMHLYVVRATTTVQCAPCTCML